MTRIGLIQRFWLVLLLAALLTGCGTRSAAPDRTPAGEAVPPQTTAAPRTIVPARPSADTGPATSPQSPGSVYTPQAKPAKPSAPAVTADSAESAVLKHPTVNRYRKDVLAAGYNITLRTEETPSRYIVGVGENQGDRNVMTHWFLVSKADGTITEWNIVDGPLPRD